MMPPRLQDKTTQRQNAATTQDFRRKIHDPPQTPRQNHSETKRGYGAGFQARISRCPPDSKTTPFRTLRQTQQHDSSLLQNNAEGTQYKQHKLSCHIFVFVFARRDLRSNAVGTWSALRTQETITRNNYSTVSGQSN